MSDAIIDLAKRLGKAIADSPTASDLRDVQKALDNEPQVTKLLKDFQAQSDKIAESESQQKPVEVQDKHKLQELHEKLVSSAVFKKYTAAQVEYVDLMRKVNDAIGSQMAQTEKE